MDHKQITIVTAVIRNEAGDILLAKRNQPDNPKTHGKWEFIGGGIDFGEEPEQALIREVKEEAGIDVEIIRLVPKILNAVESLPDGTPIQIIIITYECKVTGGQPKPGDPEIAELKFIPIHEVKNYDSFRNIQETIDLLLTNH